MNLYARAVAGIALAIVLPWLPALDLPPALFGLLFALGWLILVAARVLAFVEPAARNALLAAPQGLARHVGEGLFAALLLLVVLLALDPVLATTSRPGAITVAVVAWLVVHTVACVSLEATLAASQAPPRPRLRRSIRLTAALAEHAGLAAAMTMTAAGRRDMLAGPWSWADVAALPWVSLLFVLLMVVPLMRLARAAADDVPPPIRDVVVLHAAALYLHALAGAAAPDVASAPMQ